MTRRLYKTPSVVTRTRHRATEDAIHPPSPTRKWFQSQPWSKWWMEFITERDKSGELHYVTSWQFAKLKGKDSIERTRIFRCIGTKPVKLKGIINPNGKKEYKLPFLGDWQQMRAQAYFFDNESVDKMRLVVAEKMDGMEAGRGSATVILELIAKWMKYDDRLDQAFDYTPVAIGAPIGANRKRANHFFALKNQTRRALQELVAQYLQCHGINTEGLNDLGQLVMAVSQSAAKATLAGAVTGNALQQHSPALAMLMKAVTDKSETFKIPLPASLTNGHSENDIEMNLNDEDEG